MAGATSKTGSKPLSSKKPNRLLWNYDAMLRGIDEKIKTMQKSESSWSEENRTKFDAFVKKFNGLYDQYKAQKKNVWPELWQCVEDG